jgi:hypothetical protein
LTGVKRVAVTPEIAARLRRGEHVSPEEIAACQQGAGEESADKPPETDVSQVSGGDDETENEWLPDDLKAKNKRKAGAKRGRRR